MTSVSAESNSSENGSSHPLRRRAGAALSFFLRMLGIAGVKATCPPGSWPLLRVICIVGLPRFRQPLLLAEQSLCPTLPAVVQICTISMRVGSGIHQGFNYLSGSFLAVNALHLVTCGIIKPRNRTLCSLGQDEARHEIFQASTGVYTESLQLLESGDISILEAFKSTALGMDNLSGSGKHRLMSRGLSAMSLSDEVGSQSVLDVFGLSSETSSSDGEDRAVRLAELGLLSTSSSSTSLTATPPCNEVEEGASLNVLVSSIHFPGLERKGAAGRFGDNMGGFISRDDVDTEWTSSLRSLETSESCKSILLDGFADCRAAETALRTLNIESLGDEKFYSCASSIASDSEPSSPTSVAVPPPVKHIAYEPPILQRRMNRHSYKDQKYVPLTLLQQKPWKDVVFWHGRDKEGRPTLCAMLGVAVRTLPKKQYERIAEVIISHVEYAELNFMPRGDAISHEINLIVDAEGLGLMRMPPLERLQRVGFLLNRDYPGRGGNIFVTNPPVVLGAVLSVLSRTFAPKQANGVIRERGFLSRPDNVVIVNRRHREVFMASFEPDMLLAEHGGNCKCVVLSLLTPCSARAEFTQLLANVKVDPPFSS